MNKTKKFNAQIKESNDDSLKGKYIACNIINDMKAPI
jgi:hypothetical protein